MTTNAVGVRVEQVDARVSIAFLIANEFLPQLMQGMDLGGGARIQLEPLEVPRADGATHDLVVWRGTVPE